MNDTLEYKISVAAVEAQKNIKSLINTLSGVTKVTAKTDKNMNILNQTIYQTNKEANGLYRTITRLDGEGNIKSITKNVTDMKNKFDIAKLAAKGLALGIYGLYTKTIAEALKHSIDYAESLNYFNVVFGNVEKNGVTAFSRVGKVANAFQNKMAENFAASPTATLTYQAEFQNLALSQNIPAQYANILSENLTKLTYDIASLQNKELDDVAAKLAAGVMSGQTKSTRDIGIDLTENSLQAFIDRLALTDERFQNLYVSTMSFAEKQLVRYMVALEQTKREQGDFANSIESPANQLKILGTNIEKLQVAWGSLFQGIYAKILPWANAIIMVATAVAEAIASLLGIKLSDYNSGITKSTQAWENEDKAANGVLGTIKKIKRETLSFDQIHNINEDKNNGNGSSSPNVGINKNLLDALRGYDNGLDSVRMKANEIRDKIASWLGLVYDTTEQTWKFKKGITPIKIIMAAIVGLVGNKLISGLTAATNLFKKANDIVGSNKKTSLFGGMKSVINIVKTAVKNGGAFGQLSETFKLAGTNVTSFGTLAKATLSNVGQIIVGYKLSEISIGLSLDGVDRIQEEGLNLFNFLEVAAGTTGNLIGGALIGGIPGAIATGFIELSAILENCYKEARVEQFLDGQGMAFEDYSNRIINSMQITGDGILKHSETIKQLAIEYGNSQENVANARTALEEFTNSLELQNGAITKSQIKELESKFNDFKIATENNKIASDNFYIGLIKASSNSTGAISKDINVQIAEYEKLAKIRDGHSKDYMSQYEDLIKQLNNGKISYEIFTDKVNALDVAFGYAKGSTVDLTYANKELQEMINNIDWSASPEELKKSLEKVAEKYAEIKQIGSESVKTTKEEAQKHLTELQATIDNLNFTKMYNHDEWTPQMQQLLEDTQKEIGVYEGIINGYADKVNTELQSIGSTYSSFLLTALADLELNGVDSTNKFKEFTNIIETELKSLGDLKISEEDSSAISDYLLGMVNRGEATLPEVIEWAQKVGIKFNENLITAGLNYLETDSKDYVDQKYKEIAGGHLESYASGYSNTKSIESKTRDVIKSALGVMQDENANYYVEGENGSRTYAEGIKKGICNIKGTLSPELKENVVNEFSGINNLIENEGKNATSGYTNAFTNSTSLKTLQDGASSFVNIGINAIKTAQDSHSPSKVYESLGIDAINGYINGIKGKEEQLTITISDILTRLQNKVANSKLEVNISDNVTSSFNSILSKLQSFCDKWRTSINNLVRNMQTTMNGIKINGDGKVTYTSMPKISVPKFQYGGFPEDGLFMANHNELVGQFSNGKTAVANNYEIQSGIKQAVIEGMSEVVRNYGSTKVDINVTTEEGMIVDKVVRGIQNIKDTTGELPFDLI